MWTVKLIHQTIVPYKVNLKRVATKSWKKGDMHAKAVGCNLIGLVGNLLPIMETSGLHPQKTSNAWTASHYFSTPDPWFSLSSFHTSASASACIRACTCTCTSSKSQPCRHSTNCNCCCITRYELRDHAVTELKCRVLLYNQPMRIYPGVS